MEEVLKPKGLPKRRQDAHKGDFGRVLVVAGSPGMTGAAVLASESALISGCGLVRLACAKSLNPIFEVKLTAVMTLPVAETPNATISEKAFQTIQREVERYQSMVVGCGLSTDVSTKRLVQDIIRKLKKPLVLDADGLNAITGEPQILLDHNGSIVITPHPGEMARLVAKPVEDVQKNRTMMASNFARAFNCIVVLKGHKTVVTDGKRVYINKTGNSGLATAGSGDVLSGMIGSFIAQGMDGFDSAVTAVYLHGLAGDLAAEELTEYSVTSEHLLKFIPKAIAKFLKEEGADDKNEVPSN
jgi:NAD(P)H-hydrate epimerase